MQSASVEDMASIFPGADLQLSSSTHRLTWICQPRRAFTDVATPAAKMRPLGRVERLTIHHTGYPEGFHESGLQRTAEHLEEIRRFHTGSNPDQRGWADIGYHFAVDRAGRVWQLRPLLFQGAHVKNHNEHNLGVVLLGNFDFQKPSARQVKALDGFLHFLRAVYHLKPWDIVTHRELADQPTSCPGLSLQQWIDRTREAHESQ